MNKAARRISLAMLPAALILSGCSLEPAAHLRAIDPARTLGGELRIGISAPTSLDPAYATDDASQLVVGTMCDPLVAHDPRTGQLKAGIATSFTVGDHGSTVTLTLNKQARFSNGQRVTARDVLYSLSRVAAIDYGSPNAPMLDEVAGYPILHGDEPSSHQTRGTRELTGIQILSDTAFSISLRAPDADFLSTLALPFASPVPRALAAQADTFTGKPVCSGPYRLAAPYSPGDSEIVLGRTPGYRPVVGAFTASGQGYADRIVFKIYADRAAALSAYQRGFVDVVRVPAQGPAEPDAHVVPLPALDAIGMPLAKPPFDQPVVRQALSLAVDRSRLAMLVPGRMPAGAFVPPTVPSGSHDCAAAPSSPDLRRARKLLQQAHVSLAGRTVPFYFNAELDNNIVAASVATDWHIAFGVHVRLVPLSWSAFLARATGSGGFDGPFRMSWATPVAAPYHFLRPLFDSEQIGQANLERFSSPDVDQTLTDRIAKQVDDGERALATGQLVQKLCSQLPVVPLTFGAARYLIRPAIAAQVPVPVDVSSGLPALRELPASAPTAPPTSTPSRG